MQALSEHGYPDKLVDIHGKTSCGRRRMQKTKLESSIQP